MLWFNFFNILDFEFAQEFYLSLSFLHLASFKIFSTFAFITIICNAWSWERKVTDHSLCFFLQTSMLQPLPVEVLVYLVFCILEIAIMCSINFPQFSPVGLFCFIHFYFIFHQNQSTHQSNWDWQWAIHLDCTGFIRFSVRNLKPNVVTFQFTVYMCGCCRKYSFSILVQTNCTKLRQ